MSNSKKDFQVVYNLISDFISNLSDSQFASLIDGTGEIKFAEKTIDNALKESYNEVIHTIVNMQNYDDKINYLKSNKHLSNKTKIIEFCKYFKVNYKTKDTIETLINNIVEYGEENREDIIYRYNRKVRLEDSLDLIAKKLENYLDVKEAKEYLCKCNEISSKVNLIKLARRLNVFVDRESSYENILETILKSVVEAKIRSYTIRKKIITE
ncbi:hypothetical protein [uncultured Clostridium sp.]|uniref:hypothetical protein n=1 Tax=uncultured Clostridium sp. TaxID=59620 RepID=UPI0025D0696B|nr:hypothetical protein [uncultured Clostridium sp.]